jgi:hypothetical protein
MNDDAGFTLFAGALVPAAILTRSCSEVPFYLARLIARLGGAPPDDEPSRRERLACALGLAQVIRSGRLAALNADDGGYVLFDGGAPRAIATADELAELFDAGASPAAFALSFGPLANCANVEAWREQQQQQQQSQQ